MTAEQPFEFPHLDPSCDPPQAYVDAFEFFLELWAKLRIFRLANAADELLVVLASHLEHQFVAAGLMLCIAAEGRSPAGTLQPRNEATWEQIKPRET